MELQDMTTVKVYTFDSDAKPIKVSCPVVDGNLQASDIHNKVCKELGLKRKSCPCFSLFLGDIGRPCRRYGDGQEIPDTATELSFQKWCFSPSTEKEVINLDDVAAHLIYLEARWNVSHEIIKPNKEEESKLEELSDPAFVLEKMYALLCLKLPGYNSVRVDHCVVQEEAELNSTTFVPKNEISVILHIHGIEFLTAGHQSLYVSWYHVQSWHHKPEAQTIQYCMLTEAGNQCSLLLHTKQSQYLLAVTMEHITQIQASNPSAPKFYVSMIQTTDDGGTVWQNALYSPGKGRPLKDVT